MKKILPLKYSILGASLALVIMAQTSRAQIGSGWSSVTLDKAHDFDGGSYSDSGGIETFTLPATGHRMEIRLKPDYGDGQRQFEGYVKVTGDVRSSGASITQVYQHGIGLEHQTRINPAGDMYTLPGHDPLASNIFGTWIRVNVVHSIPGQSVDTYINGSWKSTQTYLDEGSTYMTKYGIYLEPDSGTTTVQWKSVQLWNKSDGSSIFSGYYQVIDRNSGKNANVKGAATTNGAVVQLYTTGTAANEEWQLKPADSGYYQIVSRNSGKVMAVQGASTADGAAVVQWSFGSSQNDQWMPVSLGNGYYNLQNRHSGLMLDVKGAATTNGTPFQQYHSNGGMNQQVQLNSVN